MQGHSGRIRESKTERIKNVISTLSFTDYLRPKEKNEEKYAVENGLHHNLVFEREKRLTNAFNMMLLVDTVLLYLYYATDGTTALLANVWLPISYSVHIYSVFTLAFLFLLEYQNIGRVHKYKFNFPFTIIRLVVNFILHPMPWLNDETFNVTYDDYDFNNYSMPLKVNYVLILLTLIKNILHLFVKMLVNTHYVGPRSKRIKKIYTVHSIDQLFAFRCIFVENPIRLVLTFYVIGYTFFSFAFKITESGVPIEGNPFLFYENCLWLTFITNTTVGYGDVRIFTHLGYFVGVCCMIWGTLVMSCILVVLINTLSLNSKEVETLTSINRVEGQLHYRQLCKEYVRMSVWRLWKNYKRNCKENQSNVQRKMRAKLSKIRRQNRLYNPTTNISELAQLQFDNAMINTEYLHNNNIQIINFINSHIFSQVLCRSSSYHSSKVLIDNIEQEIQAPQLAHPTPTADIHLQIQFQKPTVIKLEDLSSSDIESIKGEKLT